MDDEVLDKYYKTIEGTLSNYEDGKKIKTVK